MSDISKDLKSIIQDLNKSPIVEQRLNRTADPTNRTSESMKHKYSGDKVKLIIRSTAFTELENKFFTLTPKVKEQLDSMDEEIPKKKNLMVENF